jgi:predicted MPP superfamily phosphohydrolase
MLAWRIMVISIILIVIFPVNIYIARQLHKIKKIKNINNKIVSWLVSFMFLYITIGLLIWNSTNAYIIILHLFFILLIGELIYKIIRVIKKKDDFKYGQEITIGISIFVTIIYLGYGYYLAHHVIETNYEVVATKDIGVDSFRIVQITDSHVGATMNGNDFYNYMIRINKTNPDIVVVTGDFVDDDTSYKDMIRSCEGLGALETKYGVYFVYGNHDKGYFNNRDYGDKEIREELAKNNVVILEDEGIDIPDSNIYLLGRQDRQVRSRISVQDLMEDVDLNKYVVVLDHEPNDYDNEEDAKMDLVISGHTHGGQLFPLMIFDKMFGANDQIYGIEKRGISTFIVSSGIGDWAVKFKTGTVAEYVVIDLKNN